jgi:hypothetical protein
MPSSVRGLAFRLYFKRERQLSPLQYLVRANSRETRRRVVEQERVVLIRAPAETAVVDLV